MLKLHTFKATCQSVNQSKKSLLRRSTVIILLIRGRSRTKNTRYGQNTTQNTFAKLIFHSMQNALRALASSFRHKWEEAITSELDSLDENKTWEVC